ncbi:MAG: GFA family protein [Roseicyclus sp.]
MIDAYRKTGLIDGRCLCGDVTIRIDGPYVAGVGACHCGMCQRWNGMMFGVFTAEAGGVAITGDVARYAASDFAERAFCPTCGSHLWMRDTVEPGSDYEFMPGLFPAARDFPLISEIYIDHAPTYAALVGEHRRATRADYEAKNLFVEGETQ